MASWFTRLVDRVTPWDRGGEVQRRNERKKREEEERQRRVQAFNQNRPTQSFSTEDPTLVSKRPINIFEDLNKNLHLLGQDRPGVVPVFKNQNTQVVQPPKPGVVVQPEQKPQPPKYKNIFERIGDKFEANSPQDIAKREAVGKPRTYEEQVSNSGRGSGTTGLTNFVRRNFGFKGLGNIGKEVARGIIRVPETLIRTVAQPGAEIFDSDANTSQQEKNTGIRKFLYGEDPIQTYYKQSEELGKTGAEATGKPGLAKYGILAAPIIGGLDIYFGRGKFAKEGLERLAKEGTEQGAKQIAKETFNLTDEAAESIAKKASQTSDKKVLQELVENAAKNQGEKIAKTPPVRETVGDNLDIPASPNKTTKPSVAKLKEPSLTPDEDWAKNYAERSDKLFRESFDIGQKLKTAKKAERVVLENKKVRIDKQAADLENDFIKKHGGIKEEPTSTNLSADASPDGAPITTKPVNSIPATDQTVVPQNLPETPGTVRVTEATAPMVAKTEAVANAPVVTTPVSLPKETQAILDNPKQFNKRQVAAARNQEKLAKKYAKSQEGIAKAMERVEASKTNPGAGQPEGFAPTGEFRVGKRGNVSETATRATEAQAGTREMANRSVDDLLDEIAVKEALAPGDRRRISAAKENLMKADPENFRSSDKYKILDTLEKSSRSDLGRGLALIPRTIRKTSNADALTARWERKVGNVLDDPTKMTDGQWKQVQGANDTFTAARDKAGALEEQFRRTGSEADYKAWEQAYLAARNADTAAKMTEVKVAQDILKGEKGANVTKTIDALKKEADVNTMDFVSANMLSGTGTGFRNIFGTELAGIENRVGANLRAKITKSLFGENVGGFERQGARFGRKYGVQKWVGDAKRRANIGGKNPIEWAKNWSTTLNSGGESSLQSQVYSRLAKYYKNQFDDMGLAGKDLNLRMKHAMITDPDEMGGIYLDSAMKSSGLTGLFEKGQTIEKAVVDYIGRNTDSKFVQGASKLFMRMAVGFPTATGNFLYQSSKRLTLGLPSWIETGAKLARGDKKGAAMAFDRGLKEAGSGGAILGLGVALGSAGVISGSYPSDPEERERWTREGISENSIKIGNAWYPIPQGAGMLGLPLLTGASIGRDGAEGLKEMYKPGNFTKLLPTDQVQGFLNMLSGDESPQALKNALASTVRAVTPVGALLNQIAKSFDSTKNDTTQHGLFHNVLDQVISGIPGVNNMVDIADKTDAEGNVIRNPNAAELAFGATSAVQGGGEQRSQEINEETNSILSQIDQYGLLNDPNLEGVLEDSGLDAYNKAKSGKQLDESDIKALKEGLVKGVSAEGTDTAYLEREQYDTNLAVLKLKRDLMKDDPTVKPSSLKDVETAIKRGEIYRNSKIPYDLISEYQSVGVEEWRDMGDPESEDYNPEMYQALFDIDQMMTKAGVSYKKGALDKPKYTAKGEGKGGRGGKTKQVPSDIGGTLKDIFAPKVREYEGIDGKSGSVPVIRTVRPNIVHKITSSG